eukprot:1590944-Rhodomonas_salina.2
MPDTCDVCGRICGSFVLQANWDFSEPRNEYNRFGTLVIVPMLSQIVRAVVKFSYKAHRPSQGPKQPQNRSCCD